MERKYILVINDPNQGKYCYRGEGTRGQIQKDIRQQGDKKMEVIPVVGKRLITGSFFTGIIVGVSMLGIGWYIKKKLDKMVQLCEYNEEDEKN